MKITAIILNIFAVSLCLSIAYVFYTDYYRNKNKKRTPYDHEQERLMKTVYPDDPEPDYTSWKKYIFNKTIEQN